MTCVGKTTSSLLPRCGSNEMCLSLLRSSADTVGLMLKQAKNGSELLFNLSMEPVFIQQLGKSPK